MSSILVYGIIILVIIGAFVGLIIAINILRHQNKKLKKENSNLYRSIDDLKKNIEALQKYTENVAKINQKKEEYEKEIKNAKTKEDRDRNMDILNDLNSRL